jgi:broad specificity phosphatase PhoE
MSISTTQQLSEAIPYSAERSSTRLQAARWESPPGYYWLMTTTITPIILALALLATHPALAADIYLVRHAEKELDGSQDPDLTEVGTHRAANLAVMLKSAEIKRIFSSDYQRTRNTAAPVAEVAGVEMELYNPKALEALAGQLLRLKENALVVGHSNTTTDLVTRLGGDAGSAIVEEWEYDRLYLLQTENGKVTRTILLHLPPGTTAPQPE